ncbi:MAG: hypothetical protein ABI432_13380 [Flavobacteriales bacterium]
MTLIEFNKLPAQQRTELIWTQAIFLCTDDRGWTSYYALGGFFVEVVWYRGGKITNPKAFYKGSCHQRLLQLIELNQLELTGPL